MIVQTRRPERSSMRASRSGARAAFAAACCTARAGWATKQARAQGWGGGSRLRGAYRGSEETAGATQTPPTAHPESRRWAGSCPATVCAPLSIRLVTDCMPAACERIHVATDGGGDRSPKPHLLRLPPRPIPHRAPCFAVGGGSIFDRHGVTRCLWGKARARR